MEKLKPKYPPRTTRALRISHLLVKLSQRRKARNAQQHPVGSMGLILPYQLVENLYIDEAEIEQPPQLIVLVDDVLTAGAHSKAAQRILNAQFPNTPITGVFIARRAPGTNDIEELFK